MESDSKIQVRNINFGKGIEPRVDKITDTLERVAQENYVLMLKEGIGEIFSNKWSTTCLVDEFEVYDRDDDIEEIVEFLLSYKMGIV